MTEPWRDPGQYFDLRERVVIVTGGGRGIGNAIAAGLANAGATVVVTSRTEDVCLQAADRINDAGGKALGVATDVKDKDSRERLIDTTIETFGHLDVLVNNAGVLKPHHTVKVTEEELDEILLTNLKGPLFLSQYALPFLAATHGGSIINISALGAFQPMPGLGAYCASKAAMVNWTSTLAKEWAEHGVRVNLLVPGPVATDMILPRDAQRRAAFLEDMAAQTLVGRIAVPEDLVGAALFLASDASLFMTGRSLFLDGGMLV